MKVFLTIWISAVLIQEVIPGTLVRLPRHTPKHPALVETEYEAKYEQTGQNGNENSGLFSGKQEIVHDNCADNWNVFADKCAALIKDLVASLASTVSSRPGDATKLQLQIKNTFRHFDNTHNCTCLNDAGKSIPTLDLSCLFNNVTINTIAPTANVNRNSAGANNENESENGQFSNGNNGFGLREGVVGLGSKGDRDDGHGHSEGQDNNFGTLHSHHSGVSRKPNTALDHAKNPGFSPENDEGSEAGSSSRRQAEYPQVSWQPGNKTRHSQINHGRSNNISRSRYPFVVTPQPNSAYGSPALATYSDGNNLPNGGNEFGSDGQRNSNASPAGASGESGIPLRIHTLPASDSHYTSALRVPAIDSHNSAHPRPPAFDDHHDAALVPAIPAPGGHNSKNGYSLSKAPVTDDSYDSKPVPVQPMTDGLGNSQPGTIPSIEPRGPKFPKNNSPNSGIYSNKPLFVLSTSTNETPENPQSSDSHAHSKNQNNRPVAEIIQPVSSLTPEDSWLDSISGTPNTKPILTIGKPEVFSAEKDARVRIPVINSDSNIPESRGPESQWGTTNPLSTGRNLNPSSADVKTGSSAIPEVLPASIIDESEYTTSASTTNKFRDTMIRPLDHVPPLIYVKPALPEADSHKSEDPLDAGHTLNNPSGRTSALVTETPTSLSQNFDLAGGSGSENVYGKPQREPPLTVYPVYIPTTMRPLSYNNDVKLEENSSFNGNDNYGKSNTGEEDYEENHAEDTGKILPTVLQPPGQSLQDTGTPQSNVEAGGSNVQNGFGQSPVLRSVSKTYSDNEDGDDCDENMDSDPAIDVGIGNEAIPAVNPASKISNPVVQILPESVPASEDGEYIDAKTPTVVLREKPVSIASDPVVQANAPSLDEGDDHDENSETGNDAKTPVAVSLVEPISKASDPSLQVVQGNVPNSDDGDDCDENPGTGNDGKTPIVVSPVQPIPTVSDPAVQLVQGSIPASDVGGENTGSRNDPNKAFDRNSNIGTVNGATAQAAVSPVQPLSTVSESAAEVEQGNNPASHDDDDDCDEITERSNDATIPDAVSLVESIPKVSDPAIQVVQGNVPDSDVGENLRSSHDRNSVSDSSSKTGTANGATAQVAVPPVQPLSTVSESAAEVEQGNDPASHDGDDDDDCDEITEHSNDGTIPDAVSLVEPIPKVSDPAIQVVQGNVPDSDVGGENTGSSNDPNNVSDISSNTGSIHGETTKVALSPVQPVPKVSDTAVQVVQGNVPAPGDGSEDVVAMSPVQPVLMVSDPAVQLVQENVPGSDDGGESTGSGNDPNHLFDTASNKGTTNDATASIAVSQVQPPSRVSEPAGQSLQSGGSLQPNTGSGIESVQNDNGQSIAINVTPLPYTHLADGYTPISTSREGQSGNPGNEDSALYKPTTFQTTATDPTSPQSILIPTESTGRSTHVSTASQSSVGGLTSPVSKENDDDDEDEDCCSCESCSEDEVTDPKLYKETACKNLEEARRELKAIFDKIKKKLKCGRKAVSTIATR